MIEPIIRYFPEISAEQRAQFEELDALYRDWNGKINVISRKDIDNLFLHHVLHSLAVAKVVRFVDGTEVLDVGTGGGFPGIPLAILFPKVNFHLVDSIGKKILVASEVASALGLKNCRFTNARVEAVGEKCDFVVSRAVMLLEDLVRFSGKNISKTQRNAIPNGIICLKGGAVEQEVAKYKKRVEIFALSEFFEEEFFETKKAIFLPI